MRSQLLTCSSRLRPVRGILSSPDLRSSKAFGPAQQRISRAILQKWPSAESAMSGHVRAKHRTRCRGSTSLRSKSDISSSFDGPPPMPPALPFMRCRSEPQELPPVEEAPEGEQLERPLASSHSIHLGLDQLGLDQAEVTPPLQPRRARKRVKAGVHTDPGGAGYNEDESVVHAPRQSGYAISPCTTATAARRRPGCRRERLHVHATGSVQWQRGDARGALKYAFRAVEAEIRSLPANGGRRSGATALVALVTPQQVLHLAWAGDCRAVLCRAGGTAHTLTTDHTAACERERQRVEREGGTVAHGRLGGFLEVTRAARRPRRARVQAGGAVGGAAAQVAAAALARRRVPHPRDRRAVGRSLRRRRRPHRARRAPRVRGRRAREREARRGGAPTQGRRQRDGDGALVQPDPAVAGATAADADALVARRHLGRP